MIEKLWHISDGEVNSQEGGTSEVYFSAGHVLASSFVEVNKLNHLSIRPRHGRKWVRWGRRLVMEGGGDGGGGGKGGTHDEMGHFFLYSFFLLERGVWWVWRLCHRLEWCQESAFSGLLLLPCPLPQC